MDLTTIATLLATVFGALGVVVAVIVGRRQIDLQQQQIMQDKAKENNQAVDSLPASISTHQQPSPWLPTNHSKSIIDYEPVLKSDIKANIDEILKKSYKTYVGGIYKIDAVSEVSASFNYRVKGIRKNPILLRFNKIVASEQALITLQAIQRHVFESEAFLDSPFRNCLIPFPSASGKYFEQFNGHLIEVYPFAENVTHYSGKSLTQVKTFARKYGLVQKALRNLDTSINLSTLGNLHPYISWPKERPDFFDLVCKNSSETTMQNRDSISILFNQHKPFLKEVWYEVKSYLDQEEDILSEPALINLHPHNTFFQGDECVLIYDYDPVLKDTPETDVLAFTLHRFIREYVRSLIELRHVNPVSEIPAVVDIFLEHYSSVGLQVPVNFKNNLCLAILKTNLAKLLQIMSIYYKLSVDGDRRNPDVWYAEAVKFISYLQEAKHFKI